MQFFPLIQVHGLHLIFSYSSGTELDMYQKLMDDIEQNKNSGTILNINLKFKD